MRTIVRHLIEACQYGDTLAIEKLLFRGANPNAKDESGKPLIIIATEYGYLKIITTLIQYGAYPYATDRDGRTALHYAVEYQHHDIAQYLITQLKLNPNSQNHCGYTPLMTASVKGDIEMLRLLVQHGADPHTTDHDGKNALHRVVVWKQYEIAQYLITELKLDPNTQDKDGITPFMIAVIHGDIKMLRLLIQYGANPHTTDRDGQNVFHYAAKWNQYEIAQYLITELNLDPNSQDHQGITPLMIAAQKGDIDILQLLAQHGADPNITDHQGRSALHHALEKRHRDIAQYLITQTHINPNIQDQRGYTPFLIATQNGDIEILRLLIQHGADPYATDHQGRSALHYALENRNSAIARYLITELKLDPNTQDHDGITPFLLAAKNRDIHIPKLLIQLGANPYVTDQHGRTALHYAIKYDHHNIFKYLITQLHLDPNTQDHDGNTPLLIAVKRWHWDERTVNTLIQLGANPYIPNHQGQNPAAIARQRRIRLPKPQPSTITL